MVEDRSSKTTKSKKGFGNGGSYSIKEVTFTCKQKTLMFGYACLVRGIWHWLSCLPGKSWIANPLKYSTEGFNCEIKWSSDSKYGVIQTEFWWLAALTLILSMHTNPHSSRKRSVSQHKWIWGCLFSGMLSVTVRESPLKRLPVSYCKLHIHLLSVQCSWPVPRKSAALPACFKANIFTVLDIF